MKIRLKMLVLAISLLAFITACTSFQPVKMAPVQLQENISSGSVVEIGTQVKLQTSDGKEYEFAVTSISATHISGKEVSIPIKDVVALEISEVSGLKTTLFTSSIIAIVAGFAVASSFLM